MSSGPSFLYTDHATSSTMISDTISNDPDPVRWSSWRNLYYYLSAWGAGCYNCAWTTRRTSCFCGAKCTDVFHSAHQLLSRCYPQKAHFAARLSFGPPWSLSCRPFATQPSASMLMMDQNPTIARMRNTNMYSTNIAESTGFWFSDPWAIIADATNDATMFARPTPGRWHICPWQLRSQSGRHTNLVLQPTSWRMFWAIIHSGCWTTGDSIELGPA